MAEKKSQIIVFVIIIVLLLVGGWYIYNLNYSSNSHNNQNNSADMVDEYENLSQYFSNEDIIEKVDKNLTPDEVKRYQQDLKDSQEIQKDENNAYQGFMGEALAYMHLGDYKTSLAKLKAMEKKYPNDELVSMNLGDLYIKMHQYLLAARAMHAAVDKKPSEVLTHLRLAELYEKYAKDPLLAEGIYKKALIDTNGNEEIKKAYAVFLENIKKDYSAAIAIWSDLLSREKDTKLQSAIKEKISELEKKQKNNY